MPRYKLTVEYNGTAFVGWQVQPEDASVQSVLQKAVLHVNGIPAIVQGAGRTDSGVHATGQVAHVDMVRKWDPFALLNALNAMVRPHLVSIVSVEDVPDNFNARFSATKRHYLYRILNRRAPPALDKGQVWHVPIPLDSDAMHQAAQGIVGHHDFSTYRAIGCQALSAMRTLDRLDVMRFGEFIEIHTSSRSFLHNQVRSMVGSLKYVGEGKWHPGDMRKALDAKDRKACGPVAPADGLYLVKVDY